MGLLTGSQTPTSMLGLLNQQNVPAYHGMLRQGIQRQPQVPAYHGLLGQQRAMTPPPAPTPQEQTAPPGSIVAGPVMPSSAATASAPSAAAPAAQNPIDWQGFLTQILGSNDWSGLLGALARPQTLNWLQQQVNPNGVPYQGQLARPASLDPYYGQHGISPTDTAATAASPVNYVGLYGASDPQWGSNAMPGLFPQTPSPMMQAEAALQGTPYADYSWDNYINKVIQNPKTIDEMIKEQIAANPQIANAKKGYWTEWMTDDQTRMSG